MKNTTYVSDKGSKKATWSHPNSYGGKAIPEYSGSQQWRPINQEIVPGGGHPLPVVGIKREGMVSHMHSGSLRDQMRKEDVQKRIERHKRKIIQARLEGKRRAQRNRG